MNKELTSLQFLCNSMWGINLYNSLCASTSYKVRHSILLMQNRINLTIHNVYRVTKTTVGDTVKGT